MSYNGTGTFNINTAGQPVVTGTTITSTAFNLLTADLAVGLTTALTKDGQTTPTANIPMGTFKITGLGAGTALTDAAQFGQLQAGATQIATVTGTDTIAGTLTPTPTAYATGNLFSFVAANTNTGAATINLNSLGAKSITKLGSTALVAGDIVSGRVYLIEYDGTRFQLINPTPTSGTVTSVAATVPTFLSVAGSPITSSGTLALTLSGTALPTTSGGTGLSSFTANGVVYASSTSALATGSALTFDGAQLGVNGITVGRGAGAVSTNTAVGASALAANTTGASGVAIGNGALQSNTTGFGNTAVGYQAAYSNTTGVVDAFGYFALQSNTTGNYSVAFGSQSLTSNTTGGDNSALGFGALYSNTTGSSNTGIGRAALFNTTTASNNTAVGYQAGYGITTGSSNTYIGYAATQSGATVTNEVVVGASLTGKGSNTAFIGGTSGAYNGANSLNWSVVSDVRIKKNVAPLESGLAVIQALRPVEFDYIANDKHDIGFIAQEYQTVLPAQVAESADGMLSLNQNLVPYLVKAIQELKAEFEAYKSTHP